jgi:hypothetical protein
VSGSTAIKKIVGARPFLAQSWGALTCVLVLFYMAAILVTFLDYGITWDEYLQSTYGEYIIRWYTSFFHDQSALTYKNLEYYGGFFDVVAQLTSRISPVGIYETRHFVNALFGLLGIITVYGIGKYLGGAFAGFLSALFLLLTPRFYGDAFNNPKDIPFACLFLVSMYYIIKMVRYLPAIPGALSFKVGTAVGLTLGIRVGGVLLIGYLGLAFVLWSIRQCILQHRQFSQTASNLGSAWKQFAVATLKIGATAYIVMILWWPSAQIQPLYHPWVSLWQSSRFEFYGDVFFEGKMIPAMEVPRYYVSKWFLITLPEFYFVGLAVFLVLTGCYFVRFKSNFLQTDPIIEYALLCAWIVLPVLLAAVIGATAYDGLRHFLFIIPPLAIMTGISIATICRNAPFKIVSAGVIGLTAISMIVTAVDMIQLHPYEYIFFNRLFGKGVREAAKSFETEYWGSSYKEGAEWIRANYSWPFDTEKITVVSCSPFLSTSYYLPKDRFNYVSIRNYRHTPARYPTLFIATTRWNCNQELKGRVVHIVARKDTPLLYVKEVADD